MFIYAYSFSCGTYSDFSNYFIRVSAGNLKCDHQWGKEITNIYPELLYYFSVFFFFSKLLGSFTMLGLPSIIYFPTARDLQQDSSNKILKKRSYSVAISSSETNEVWRES